MDTEVIKTRQRKAILTDVLERNDIDSLSYCTKHKVYFPQKQKKKQYQFQNSLIEHNGNQKSRGTVPGF
jgi:hypothetical protein